MAWARMVPWGTKAKAIEKSVHGYRVPGTSFYHGGKCVVPGTYFIVVTGVPR